jgi:hypothetical protein
MGPPRRNVIIPQFRGGGEVMLVPVIIALAVSEIAWIRVIPYEESEGELRRIYDVVKGASGNVDNVVKVHSLRPHTLEGHYALYRSVLHHPGNEMPPWLLEAQWLRVQCRPSFRRSEAGARGRRAIRAD